MQPKELKPLQALHRSLGMVVQAAPKELRNLVLINLATGIGPSVSLFLGKVVIDEASRLLAQETPSNGLTELLAEPKLLWCVVAAVVLNLVVDAIDSISTTLFASLRDRVRGYVQNQVLEKVAYFHDIALFETPALLNLVQLTEKGVERMQRLSFIMAATLMGVSTLVPSTLLSASIAGWVPLVLIMVSIPSIFVEMRHHKKSWRVEETQASLTREMAIYSKVITGESYAKELRLFSLQSVLIDRWQTLFRKMFSQMEGVRRQGALTVMLWAVFGGLGTALPYVYVVLGVLMGRFTLGDLALYTGIILQVRRSLYILIANTGDIYDVALATSPIFQLLDLQPELCDGPRSIVATAPTLPLLPGLEVKNLSFAYPGQERPILSDISFQMNRGEMVALVGENGAGKTTLAKLLCRLYDPTSGAIYLKGQDLRSLSLEALRSHIAVVMQDYAHFPATLRENVGWGSLPDLWDDSAIHTVLKEAGISQVLSTLEQGLETPLGRQLEHGVDLSGGQWQRIAIARALMRLPRTDLLVFDEPTAALDPKNEQEIYDIFRTIAQGRMAVVVSHRLALARMTDRILVLEHGRIIEAGSHDELMKQEGCYHMMFTRQAGSYL